MVDQPPRSNASRDGTPAVRRTAHERAAAELGGSSDEELLRLLSDPRLLERGHATVTLPNADATVFVKLVPLTAREVQPENRGSTANLFRLPTYYQYRLGSCGFGAWRELATHRLTNEWVTSGRCVSFPLLHHWRELPLVRSGSDDKTSVEPWGDSPAIRARTAAVQEATTSAAVFLEHFPLTLAQWLREQLRRHADPVPALTAVEARLTAVMAFLRARGLLHMDAHPENILTDGRELFLSDHGLALSRTFELGSDERRFFETHRNFDLCTALNGVVHTVVTHYDARDDWRQVLRELDDDARDTAGVIPPTVRAYLRKRAPLVLALGDFYRRLLADLTTPYPAAHLERRLRDG